MGAGPIQGEGQLPPRQDHVAAAESEGRSGWARPCQETSRARRGLESLGDQWEAKGGIVWIWLVWATVLVCGKADRRVWWLGAG